MPRKNSLLIVDDEVNVTRTLQMVFEQQGYRVFPAYSGAEALTLLQNGHAVDAVITDLNMEQADIGLEVARVAKGLASKPVVVICTGFADVNNARQALLLHVDYLANKPVDLGELTGALRRLIELRAVNRKGRN